MKRTKFWALVLFVAGCTGAIGDATDPRVPGDPDNPGNPDDPTAPGPRAPDDPPIVCDARVAQATPAGLARLTNVEYSNAVFDLTGEHISVTLPAEEERVGFGLGGNVTPALYGLFAQAAETVAEAILPAMFDDAAGVDGTLNDTEARAFIDRFGSDAYRKPLETEQGDRLMALYRAGVMAEDERNGLRLVLQGVLQSPSFLYRVEHGAGSGGALVPLSGHERAARLSFLLWDRPPDTALLDAAASGLLDTPAGVETEARRLLADDRARPALVEFYSQWLQIDTEGVAKDSTVYPDFDATLRASMTESARRFLEHVIFVDGRLDAIFRSNIAFVDGPMAQLYETDAVDGAGFEERTLDADRRSGILTRAAFHAVHGLPDQSSPIRRGLFVRDRLLCQELPVPPDNINIQPPELEEGLSTRERFEEHVANPACSGCHNDIDPIGFGFESYDGIGAFRTDEGGAPIDTSGRVTRVDGPDIEFVDAVDMSEQLVVNETFQRCVGTQWLRYATQVFEGQWSACALDEIHTRFEESGFDVRELIVAIVTSEPFLNVTAD